MNPKQVQLRKFLIRAPLIVVFLYAVSLLALGQSPTDGPQAPRVTLGLPTQLESSTKLWNDALQTDGKRGTVKLPVIDIAVPRNDGVEQAPHIELSPPRHLRRLPDPPPKQETRVAQVKTAQQLEDDSDLLVDSALEDDWLLTPSRTELTDLSHPSIRKSAVDSIPLPALEATSIADLALPPRDIADSDSATEALPVEQSAPPATEWTEIEAVPIEKPVAVFGKSNEADISSDALPLSIYDGMGATGSNQSQSASGYTLPQGNSVTTQANVGQSLGGNNASDKTQPEDNKRPGDNKLIAPEFYVVPGAEPAIGAGTQRIPFQFQDFGPTVPADPSFLDPLSEELIYRGKFAVPTQRPIVEWGKPYYSGGIYPPGNDLLGATNLIRPHLLVYGDFRTGVGINRNAQGDENNLATRLNLDIDLALTATERFHAFMGPLDRQGDFTRLDFTNSADFVNRTDLRFDTLFFEGDLGSIMGGLNGIDSTFDLPFTFGLIPLVHQNGIWTNDAFLGAAFALPAKHNLPLNWSNYDATFFWASDQITSDAFQGDNNAAELLGTAWFIDAYGGYIEADYAYVHDDAGGNRSYHNMAFGFTRRYLMRLSNSVRFIANVGQDLPSDQRTADGHLLLFENSLITSLPNTFVPYLNLFYGQGRPQSLARAGGTGGILNNVGINFETDALNGYPTLDFTGSNSYGGALGVNLLATNFSQQLILEAAILNATGSSQFRNAPGDQYAVGMRYQKPLSNAWLFRTDHMYGWRNNAEDLRGSRVELRWKF